MTDKVEKDRKEKKDKKDKSDKKEKKEKREKKDKSDKKDKKEKKVKSDKKEKKDKSHRDRSDKKDKSERKDKSKTASTDKHDKKDALESPVPSDSADIKAFYESNGISIDTKLPQLDPVLSMSQLRVLPEISQSLTKFSKPTPIQSCAWPYLLRGQDVVGVAETGSGKTLAFGVPAIEKMLKSPTGSVLVVSPTRELAMQIHDQFDELLKGLPITSVCVYGGVSKYDQQQLLRKQGARIVVGTPGRLRDLLADGSLNLSSCSYLVLDEADRMLEKGFEQDITEILGCAPAPSARQTVMFTATWPPEVRSLASSFMKQGEVVKISIGEVDELHANKRITQIVEVVDPRMKERRLLELLQKYTKNKEKVLVFALYKKEASRVQRMLEGKGYRVAAVHGDLGQQQRTLALNEFKSGKTNLMLATDVAARGLDIPAVKVVINLTFPLTVEDYVHRIGRTGRAGQTGTAYTLFTDQEKNLAGALVNVLRDAGQPVPEDLLKFGTHTKKKEHSLYGAFYKDVDPNAKAKKIKFD